MATEDDSEIPETGAVFTFGKSKFGDSAPNKFWIRDDKVHQISCGDEHTGIVSESGKLFMFGSNEWGQLGLGHTKVVNKPSRVKALKSEKVVMLACGRNHTLAATASGKVFAFGNNGEGQLGLGNSNHPHVETPSQVQLPTLSIKMMDAGNDHSVLISGEGDVYVWGGSGEGQLGVGEDEDVYSPHKLNLNEKAVYISCGYYHTAIVTESGKLLTCGEAEGGKLGVGECSSSVRVPTRVDAISGRVVHVACGGSQTIAVTDDGKAYSFGDGANGQLGHGTKVLSSFTPQQILSVTDQFSQACCGENHSALITKKGSMYTFGDGRHGKLALGDENFANQFKPCLVHRFKHFHVESVSCGGCHTLVRAKFAQQNGDIWSGSDSEEDQVDNLIREPIKKSPLNKANHLYDSMDLEGSIGARNRRREKFPESEGTMNRTLPPLNSISASRALPALETTHKSSPLLHERNALNASTMPPIKQSQSDTIHSVQRSRLKDKNEDSESEVTESEEEEKPATRQQVERANPVKPPRSPKPRPVPRKRLDPIPEPRDAQQRLLPKVLKAEASQVHFKGRKLDEESEEDSEEEEREEENTKKPAKSEKHQKAKKMPKKSAAKKKSVESDSEDEKNKKKQSKYSEDDDQTEEDSEDEQKYSKKAPPPKYKAKKDAHKKHANIFGKKKILDSDEDEESEEESEEEEEKPPKTKKEKEIEKHSKTSKNDTKKDKDTKKDNKNDKETKKEKEKKDKKKSKEKTSEDEEEKAQNDKNESDESGVDEEATSLSSTKSKEPEKDKGNEKDQQNQTAPKKSGTCSIL